MFPRSASISNHLSVNHTSAQNSKPVNDTDEDLSKEKLNDLCDKLRLPPESRVAMHKERVPLGEEQKRVLDLKHTPLAFVQNEENKSAIMLRRAPVFIVAVNATTGTFSHLFSCIGRPGQGGGNQYFSTSGDGDRGKVNVKDIISDLESREKMGKMPEAVVKQADGGKAALDTIKRMGERQFLDHADFYAAYMEERLTAEGYPPGSEKPIPRDLADKLNLEYNAFNAGVAKHHWELWNREPYSAGALADNLPRRDIKQYENDKGLNDVSDEEINSGTVCKTDKMNLRRVEVDPLKMIEKKRDYMLQRMFRDQYVNEKTLFGKPISLEAVEKFMAKLSLYRLTSPLANDRGNCASGAAQWFRDVGVPEEKILAPSNYAFGFHNVLDTWNPVKPEVKVRSENPNIDTQSIRGRPIAIDKLNEHLLVHKARQDELMAQLAREQEANKSKL